MITDDEIRDYKVKTTSSGIINKFKNEKPRKKFQLPLICICSTAFAVLAIFLMIKSFTKSKININNDVFSFQVNSLVSIITNNDTSLLADLSDTVYLDAVKQYKVFEDLIYDKFYNLEDELKYDYNNYKGNYGTYKLKVSFNSYEMLINYNNISDEESKFTGEININNRIYSIEGKQEIEEDEIELTTKIFISDDEYYIVEEEYEGDEYSYKFKIKNKNKSIYTYKLSIEENEIELKISTNNIEYEYNIVIENDRWNFEYSFNGIKLNFYMIIENNKKIYQKTNNLNILNAI